MTTGQNKSSFPGEELFGKVTEKFSEWFGDTDKRLDQTKKSVQADLDKLKANTNLDRLKQGTNTAANLYASFEKGLKKDLEEDGVRGDEAQKPYLALVRAEWEKEQMGRRTSEILASPELAALDGFISKIENLPKLKELIDSAEPEAKWRTMLMGFASQHPLLGELIESGQVDAMLALFSLGFLPKLKRDKAKPKVATAEGKKEKGKKDGEAGKDAEESKEAKRETPKSTCFIGDSITAAMESQCRAQGDKNPLKIDGETMTVAEKSMDARWGIQQVEALAAQKPSPLKNMENAVVLFGTNDIGQEGAEGTAEKIFERIERIYRILSEAGVKHVYAVTVPPFGGYALYDRRPEVNAKREELNRMIRGEDPKHPKSKYVYRVIDTCKKESEGGLADNNDPNKYSSKANIDWLHPNKIELAKLYQRELEIGSAQPA